MTVRPISAKLQEIAKNELNEVHENVQDCIETIKEWLIKQTYINSRTGIYSFLNFINYISIFLIKCFSLYVMT